MNKDFLRRLSDTLVASGVGRAKSYECIAAFFGFGSYTAFQKRTGNSFECDIFFFRERCERLGVPYKHVNELLSKELEKFRHVG